MKTIAFPITSRCEENCLYCFRAQQKDVSLEEFKVLLGKALKENPDLSKVVVTGGNPELNTHFWDICGEVKRCGLKLKIHSNYFNKATWPKYAELADEISIPIDSLDKQIFRSASNALGLMEAFDYFFPKVAIQVHSVAAKGTVKDLWRIRRALDKKGFFGANTKNSWKIFRLVGVNGLKKEELDAAEWGKVKQSFGGPQVKFVDNVLEYA